MPTTRLKKDEDETKPSKPVGLGELDRVRLKNSISNKGRMLTPGLTGTIVLCHGTEAYEVEFDTIGDDFFQVSAKDLEKA